MLRALAYWQARGLAADLVILNMAVAAVAAPLQSALEALIKREDIGKGKAVALRADALSPEQRDFLQMAAREVFDCTSKTLREQLARPKEPPGAARLRRENSGEDLRTDVPNRVPALEFFNGLGGFDEAAREYVVVLSDGQWTPAPWINVIANPQFGFLVSADGSGSTWSLNAQQNQITPWCNDPVSDTPAETIYIRDEDSGDLWSAAPLPIRERSSVYVVRHGFGYTRSEHTAHGIALSLTQFVPLQDPIKISRLKIKNISDETRQLSITHYLDWVLGNQNNRAAPFIITSDRARIARPAGSQSLDHGFQVAHRLHGHGRAAAKLHRRSRPNSSAVMGRSPSRRRSRPASAEQPRGGGLDPCGAMQTKIT